MNQLKIILDLPEDASLAVKNALALETQSELMSRSKVSLTVDEGKLTLSLEAQDLHGLRACLNTYLRWVIMVSETLEVAK